MLYISQLTRQCASQPFLPAEFYASKSSIFPTLKVDINHVTVC